MRGDVVVNERPRLCRRLHLPYNKTVSAVALSHLIQMFFDLSPATGWEPSSVSFLIGRCKRGHQVSGAAFAFVVAWPKVVTNLVGQGVLCLRQTSERILETTETTVRCYFLHFHLPNLFPSFVQWLWFILVSLPILKPKVIIQFSVGIFPHLSFNTILDRQVLMKKVPTTLYLRKITFGCRRNQTQVSKNHIAHGLSIATKRKRAFCIN